MPEFRDRFVKWAGEIEQGRKPDFGDRALLEQNLKVREWKRPGRDLVEGHGEVARSAARGGSGEVTST